MEVPVFVINLDRSPERWKSWEALQGIHRIKAIDGKDLDIRTDPRVSIRTRLKIHEKQDRTEHYQINTVGAIGCYLSHMLALEEIVKQEVPYGIVCEDDLHVSPKVVRDRTLAQYIMDHVDDTNFDLIVVNPYQVRRKNPLSFTGCYCLVWSLEGARKALSMAFPVEQHLDSYLSLLNEISMLRVIPLRLKGLYHASADASNIAHTRLTCKTGGYISWVNVGICLILMGILIFTFT